MSLTIPYRTLDEYIPVDIEQLRPRGSYKNLIEKRTHSIDQLVAQYGKIPDDLLQPRPCPTCGSDDYAMELEKDHLQLVRCQKCDLVYTNPIFDEAHYKEIYQSETYQDIVRQLGIDSHAYRTERFGMERVAIMRRYIPKSILQPKYLDVGCSTGFVVEAAQNAGWDAAGIDLNPSAIKFGQERGLNLAVEALEDIDVPPGTYDAVSLFDVIEHLTNPGPILEQSIRLLKPGGIVFLYVPNYDSASRLLMGKHAHFIWPTHHLNYYTPQTLSDFLQRYTLNVEMVVTEGLDLADYIWYQEEIEHQDMAALKVITDKLQFFINAGSYGKNLRIIGRK